MVAERGLAEHLQPAPRLAVAIYAGGDVTEVACWAHARRKFFEVAHLWRRKSTTIPLPSFEELPRCICDMPRVHNAGHDDPKAGMSGRAASE
ncbi:MAG: IS66 family transposase [Planctomycetota bacterium]